MNGVTRVGLPRKCPVHGEKTVPGQAILYFPISEMCCNVCGRMSVLDTFEVEL